ncbi:MAG TPA: hypothetical protein VFY27_11620 [Woeseiaceae bacterium]|nr:hypothetical protein [Woeseiaceae bacterium]
MLALALPIGAVLPYDGSSREGAGCYLVAGRDIFDYHESVECFACAQGTGGDADVISRIELQIAVMSR